MFHKQKLKFKKSGYAVKLFQSSPRKIINHKNLCTVHRILVYFVRIPEFN